MKTRAQLAQSLTGYQFSEIARYWSFTPEKVGERYREDLLNELENAQEKIYKAAGQGFESEAEKVFERYESGLRVRYLAACSAESRTASTMVTGPANFPTRRNEKALAAARNRWDDVQRYRERLNKWCRRLSGVSNGIRLGASDAEQAILDHLRELEANQERYKAINKIARKRLPREVKVAQLVAAGICSEKVALALTEPGNFGGDGIPEFEIRNNSANIRRYRERLAAVQREQATRQEREQASATEYTLNGIEVSEDAGDDRIRLRFPGRPTDAQREALKRSGWRWSPSNGAWQRQLTPNARYAAKEFCTKHGGAA